MNWSAPTERVDAAGLGIAVNGYEIEFDQYRITKTPGRLLADRQIDANTSCRGLSREARFTESPYKE